MLDAVFARHFDFVGVREHADLIAALVDAPDNEWNFQPHRHLHRPSGLAGKHVPIK